MHQPVLVHPDVHERAECRHVGHGTLQHHARFEVGDLLDPFRERGRREGRTGVPARLLQLGDDVLHRGQAEGAVHEVLRIQRRIASRRRHFPGGRLDFPRHRVGLGVHAGGVQRFRSPGDPQEARALLERFGTKPRDLLQFAALGERAVLVPVGHDVLAQQRPDAGHPAQQRRRGRVDVHAHRIHTVLDHRVQAAVQLRGRDIVLVLPDADRLRLDLHELRERVLQPPGNRDGTAQGHVHARQLGRGERRGRIDGRSGLGHHDLLRFAFRPRRLAVSTGPRPACPSPSTPCRCRSRRVRRRASWPGPRGSAAPRPISGPARAGRRCRSRPPCRCRPPPRPSRRSAAPGPGPGWAGSRQARRAARRAGWQRTRARPHPRRRQTSGCAGLPSAAPAPVSATPSGRSAAATHRRAGRGRQPRGTWPQPPRNGRARR